jgi:hypothetical protein
MSEFGTTAPSDIELVRTDKTSGISYSTGLPLLEDRYIKGEDDTDVNSTKAKDLYIVGGSKTGTGSTGNGGDVYIDGGTTTGGTAGRVILGAASSSIVFSGLTSPPATWTALLNANGGIAVDTTNFTVSGTTGAVHTAGDFDVATTKFTVAAASGDTVTAGTLQAAGIANLNGGIAVDTTNFTVDGTTGATHIAGQLDVSGSAFTVAPTTGFVTSSSGIKNGGAALTAGTMTAAATGYCNKTWSKYTWTNAQVAALGASLTGDIAVCTLPAKTVVHHALVVLSTQAAGCTTLTGSVGITGADYIDFIVASDLKAAANTIYGNAKAELGAALYDATTVTPFYVPSWTATSTVNMHFISTVDNLSAATTCSGAVYLLTSVLP